LFFSVALRHGGGGPRIMRARAFDRNSFYGYFVSLIFNTCIAEN